jgi:hypothetical protein
MATSMLRRVASAWIRWIWWLLPSASAIQLRAWAGSRRQAWSNTLATTVLASWTTLAVSHWSAACGPVRAARRWSSVLGSTSPGVRGTGVAW